MSRDIVEDVERCGWHGTVIGEDDEGPGFEYTTGLGRAFDHPELIVFGLPADVGHSVLSDVVARIRAGERFATIGTCTLPRWKLHVRLVHPQQVGMYFADTIAFYRGELPVGAVQLFWPDREGRSRFDLRCDAFVASLQPRLDVPPSPSELREFQARYGRG